MIEKLKEKLEDLKIFWEDEELRTAIIIAIICISLIIFETIIL